MLSGRVDELKDSHISGWAFNSEQPSEHIVVRIMRWPQVIATGVANLFRRDLPDAGLGDGDHAFTIALPPNITSLEGLTVIAQSVKHGEITVPVADLDDRKIDEMFAALSTYYEDALIALKEEMDALRMRQDALEEEEHLPASIVPLPDDLAQRLIKLETRMESAEVFFIRIDEAVRQLVNDNKKRKKRRFFGIF